ncbi:hypothetical protein N0V93_004858 [Gnomoniopsis smithogilvyi]|uniref:Major facilitator superfamily (MFS) profile domain-containing protein n=1 Tax=Gnomoniopsis smithogilvyi TaxID=1191159 RepID=A0A9W8YRT5_9PEZI|nr:hypothetical protein N0V93_004858 [Gnomoniopsis smithogilvyi]
MSEKEISEKGDLEVANARSDTSISNKAASESEHEVVNWTPEEEKKLVRKLDWIILPPLVLAFFALQLDRGNIGAAYTDGFTLEIGIGQDEYNTGNTLMSVGIVLLEVIAIDNLILYKIGPTIWIGAQVFAWGLVATFQAFQKGLGPFLATRFLLGLCESGFIPAGLFTLSRWYKKDEISKRFAVFFFGNNLATALSGLLASGILRLEGAHGLYGWQWIFIIEGIYTVFAAIYFMVVFPKSPMHPVSLFKIRWFNERDAHILTTRVLVDDPARSQARKHVRWKDIKEMLLNWRLFSHIIIPLAALAPSWTFGAYAPFLVMEMGYTKLKANALCSAAGFMLLPINMFWGFTADKARKRGLMVSLGLAIYLAFAIGNREIIKVDDKTMRLPMLLLLVGFSTCWHPVNCAWVSLNAKTPEERSISMAAVTMCANLAGIIGNNLFRSEDGPWYPHGWGSICGCIGTALGMSIFTNIQYWVLNRRLRNKEGVELWHT